MIDKEGIKQSTNILDLIGKNTDLRRAATTNGGEYSGACPFCGGKDRFRVWPRTNKFWCRGCDSGGDVIDYVMQRDSVNFQEACKRLGRVDNVHDGKHIKPEPRPAYEQPAQDWQASALKAISHCEKTLYKPEGKPGLNYLHGRGLSDETIKHFRLGYAPHKLTGSMFTVWAGVVIPCVIAGCVWYIKIRSLVKNATPKYLMVKGSKANAIYNAGDITEHAPCVICEGEFNTMIAWQELQDVCAFVSPGGAAKNKLDLALWGAYLAAPERLIACFDDDKAGESGAAALAEQLGAFNAPTPEGDINDYFLSGGQLWKGWLQPALANADTSKGGASN